MDILGVNAFHGDASACLVRDGVLVAAAEEERFRRIKHWAGFPTQAVAYCLAEGKIALSGLDHVAVNQDSSANQAPRLAYVLRSRPDLNFVLGRLRNGLGGLACDGCSAIKSEENAGLAARLDHAVGEKGELGIGGEMEAGLRVG